MASAEAFERHLKSLAQPEYALQAQRFFKLGPGEYAEGDRFLGLRMPQLRNEMKAYRHLSLSDLAQLLHNPWHEIRMGAGLILVDQYEKARKAQNNQQINEILNCLIHNRGGLNNWDLVDTVIPKTLGVASRDDAAILKQLRKWLDSRNLWERRMAMLATQAWNRAGDDSLCHEFARVLLHDPEDLIHKAVGWMLREAGQKHPNNLRAFLDQHATTMPRTMLRYALEKLPPDERKSYLQRPRQ